MDRKRWQLAIGAGSATTLVMLMLGSSWRPPADEMPLPVGAQGPDLRPRETTEPAGRADHAGPIASSRAADGTGEVATTRPGQPPAPRTVRSADTAP